MRQRALACLLIFVIIAVLFPINAYGASLLKYGSRGNEVEKLQQQLIKLGYLKGKADGIFGPQTQAAVIKFQKDYKLKQDGIVGNLGKLSEAMAALQNGGGSPPPSNGGGSSNNKLPITTTLKMGSRGSQVQVLQKRLNELGFNCGAVDGIFGNKTHNAVVQFQKARGLTANGIVDTKTVEKLFSDGPSQEPEPEPDPDPDTGFKQFHGTPGTLAGKTIFVDAGHGGVDSGATRNGVMEKTLVLDMALRLKRILEEAGAKVILTRPDDKFYSLHYRSAYVNSYILNNELSELNKERNDAVSERDAKQAEVDNKAQEIIQKEADISSYTAELEAKEAYLSQLETQKNELDERLTSARDDYENKEMAYNEKYAEYKPLEDELIQAQNDLDALKSQRDEIQNEIDEILPEGKTAEEYIDELGEEIEGLESQLEDESLSDEQRQQLQAQLQEAEEKLNKLTGWIALNTQISEKEGYIADIEAQLEALADDLDLDNLKQAMEQAKALWDEIASELDVVQNNINEVNSSIVSLNNMINKAEDAVEQLRDAIEALEDEIEALEKDIEEMDKQIQNVNTLISKFQEHIVNYGAQSYTGAYAQQRDPVTGKRYATPELKAVMDLAAQKYHDDYLFISIHCNDTSASQQTSASGITIFYRDNGPYSYNGTYGANVEYYLGYNAQKRERLALKLLEQLNITTDFSKKYYYPYKADFSVLRENNLISVLVEVGFMNNPNDLALLVKEQTREDTAAGIYKGIVEYYK